MFDRGTYWTQGEIYFQAVHAQHSDDAAMGVLITYHDKTYYVTGDTLYHDKVIEDVKKTGRSIEAAFLPVNGVGNNMNMADAARFAQAVCAKKVVPIHFGLFDDLKPEQDFCCENKIVPEIYKEIKL
jgi:L-ascorbate metabolism protein UlaG (beta-lactamase superfamily)